MSQSPWRLTRRLVAMMSTRCTSSGCSLPAVPCSRVSCWRLTELAIVATVAHLSYCWALVQTVARKLLRFSVCFESRPSNVQWYPIKSICNSMRMSVGPVSKESLSEISFYSMFHKLPVTRKLVLCIVYGCNHNSSRESYKFCRFPANERTKWGELSR